MKPLIARTAAALLVWLVLAPAGDGQTQTATPTERANQLLRQGKVESAIQVLRDYLKTNGKDVQARVYLGEVLDYDGRPEEAITLWEQGLEGAASDFPLLMSIGDIRFRQGRDGPAITHRRGMVGASPDQNEAESARYKHERLGQARAAYEKARKLRPRDPDVLSELASVYSFEEKHDDAAQIWKSLVAIDPKNAGYLFRLALATRQAGRPDEAMKDLKEAIAIDPRLGQAHEALAEILEAKGRALEAKESRRRGEFYRRLPAFCTLVYSPDHSKMLESLNKPETVRKLVNDPSNEAAEFLAVLCWTHPHNQLETSAFESLDSRGAATTAIVDALLKEARSTCTIRSAARILARRKAEGLLEFLVRLLPGDVRGFGMEMDIAGSLDELADRRAIGPLIEVLNPGVAETVHRGGPLGDPRSARSRAALALGAFDTPEVRQALEKGTRIPDVAHASLAALYRLSHDQKHLDALQKAVTPADGFESYLIGNYLRTRVGTDAAKKLAQAWADARAAREAEEKAKSKGNSAKKDRE